MLGKIRFVALAAIAAAGLGMTAAPASAWYCHGSYQSYNNYYPQQSYQNYSQGYDYPRYNRQHYYQQPQYGGQPYQQPQYSPQYSDSGNGYAPDGGQDYGQEGYSQY